MAMIRMATERDAGAMLDIYAPIVQQTAISFELSPPSLPDFKNRIRSSIQDRPWLVCEAAGQILGYACATAYRSRGAYAWSVETSAYINAQFHRQGIARSLYHSLLKMLALQGYYMAFAGIALPNDASIAFHEAMGYKAIGVFQQAGYKLGRWYSVGWWQLPITTPFTEPKAPPKQPNDCADDPQWEQAIHTGMELLKIRTDLR